MAKVNFKGLDPDDLHTCQHCQHSFHDIGMNRKVCARSGQPIAPMNYIQVNDCEEYKSPYLSDYRRRMDLENQLKNKEQRQKMKDLQSYIVFAGFMLWHWGYTCTVT